LGSRRDNLISPSSVGAAIDVVGLVLIDPSPASTAVVREAVVREVPGKGIRLMLSAPEGAATAAELVRDAGMADAGPAWSCAGNSAERGHRTIITIRANTRAVIPSHKISPANPTRLFRAVGTASVDMIYLPQDYPRS
jgi:hypothetical protein